MKEKILEGREIIEGNFIFSLWKNPELYNDYKHIKANEDFQIQDSIFYFQLGKNMFDKGFNSFDNTAIYTYLEDKPNLREGFERRGGYGTVKEMLDITNLDNISVYYDELIKSNILINMQDKGFNISNEFEKFKQMTTEHLYDYYDYYLNEIFMNRKDSTKVEDLFIDDDFIEHMQKGLDVGASYSKHSPKLSYATLGVPKKDMMLIASFVNQGKTSFLFENIFMDLANQGYKICFISNEQGIENFKRLMLIHVLTDKFNYWQITRKKLKIGKFNSEELEMLNKAKEYTKEHYLGKIKFSRIYDYNINTVKKIIKKLSKLGWEYFFYDVLKLDTADNNNDYKTIINDTKELLQLGSKENVGIIPVMQLALRNKNIIRYLDTNCLSGATGASEVVSEGIFFREIWADEYPGQKYDCKPFRYGKNSDGSINYKIKEQIELEEDKKYMLFFLTKTRNDDNGLVFLYEYNGAFNKWKELGYARPHHN